MSLGESQHLALLNIIVGIHFVRPNLQDSAYRFIIELFILGLHPAPPSLTPRVYNWVGAKLARVNYFRSKPAATIHCRSPFMAK